MLISAAVAMLSRTVTPVRKAGGQVEMPGPDLVEYDLMID